MYDTEDDRRGIQQERISKVASATGTPVESLSVIVCSLVFHINSENENDTESSELYKSYLEDGICPDDAGKQVTGDLLHGGHTYEEDSVTKKICYTTYQVGSDEAIIKP
ncbi:hypothetical protein V7S43_002094 [Phytophthora oleae]|uniref:Uncharacterized protein n=1 Tax=Phytophthora oleae TaxID=2107226 RepID=A0ABD3G4Q8_9STRA